MADDAGFAAGSTGSHAPGEATMREVERRDGAVGHRVHGARERAPAGAVPRPRDGGFDPWHARPHGPAANGTAPVREAAKAGRFCPPHYGYGPNRLAHVDEHETDVAYVVGGLYGNDLALDAIEAMAGTERTPAALIFNGDFHWFDADPGWFAGLQRRVAAHTLLRGNVETELANDDDSAGCGCAYPETVPDEDVDRSNAILGRLREAACGSPGIRTQFADLPMYAVARIGDRRIGIVHGDAWSLAGWRFAHDSLHDAAMTDTLMSGLERAAVDGFACSHTCAPALKRIGGRFVINNGTAGMANFAGSTFGVMTRISVLPLPPALAAARLYGFCAHGVHVDALEVDFDIDAWLSRFDALWPGGSPAALSYRTRIARGPAYSVDHALGRARTACAN